MENKIVIIKQDTDLNKVLKLIFKEENRSLDMQVLKAYKERYEQYAIDIVNGDILCAIINGQLNVAGNILNI